VGDGLAGDPVGGGLAGHPVGGGLADDPVGGGLAGDGLVGGGLAGEITNNRQLVGCYGLTRAGRLIVCWCHRTSPVAAPANCELAGIAREIESIMSPLLRCSAENFLIP